MKLTWETLMFIFVLETLILVFLMACFSDTSNALAPGSSRVDLFKRRNSTVPFEDSNGKVRDRVVDSFRAPALVNVDGVMVAIADARYETANDNSFIETVAKYSVDDGATWKTQIAIKNSRASSVSRVMDPTVIVKGKKLYVLVGSFNTSEKYWMQQSDGSDWEPLLVVGEVTKSAVNGKTTATISWGKPVSLKPLFPAEFEGVPTKEFLGGVGAAIVASNGNLVYPVQITNMKKQIFTKIMYSEDDGTTWKFSEGRSDFGCSEPSVLEWEGKLIINNRVDGNRRLVYESSDMGKTWVEALGTLSRVWTNSPTSNHPGSQSSFIAVTIEGKRVMLFTHPLNFKGLWIRDRLNLWVTDNQRIFDVGQISVGDEGAAYSSILYKDDKLYCLHEVNIREVYGIVFVRLVEELRLIKSVVRTWKEEDNHLSSICTPVVPAAPSSRRGCGAVVPTAGLVGFLSHRANRSVWEDVYRCVNANVMNGINVAYGFTFKGRKAGAMWPVRKQGQSQRYHFVNYRFTLVASVSIHEIPKSTRPLLGASLDGSGNRKLLGLSYDKDQRWCPIYGPTTSLSTGSWELHKTYHVTLLFEEGVGSVYIDGNPLKGSGQMVSGVHLEGLDVSHFFFGRYGANDVSADCHITVTNVMLYNRGLQPNEIRALLLGVGKMAADPENKFEKTFHGDITDMAGEHLLSGSLSHLTMRFILILFLLLSVN
ncbi:sialidase [Trypanosoma rangeli]|uniref:Sialidase n=1 Tax=Trypanosoma rangeli TaxID=5698 RepID=A0A422MV43_TRYRA|nr:sialidase [Trypanosoma rangeli]RNE97115.1 sialidase [Trypanosoma rangeli]|eukprot:RNE97115.1 sialidase [Trypanosoma rangeli]